MKEFYQKPVVDVEEFKTTNVISTSVPKDDNDVEWVHNEQKIFLHFDTIDYYFYFYCL